jgi:hypothetical protein
MTSITDGSVKIQTTPGYQWVGTFGNRGNGRYREELPDEDKELDLDRWCSHSAWGQECWQLIAQWVWNLRINSLGSSASFEQCQSSGTLCRSSSHSDCS